MAQQLFLSKDRNEAHAFLEKALVDHPQAECREMGDAGTAVFDGPCTERQEAAVLGPDAARLNALINEAVARALAGSK